MSDKNVLDISWGAIAKIFFALVIFYLLYQITDILVWFLFALVISVLFNPLIEFLKNLRIPRPVAVLSVYFVFFGILTVLIYLGTPVFYEEIRRFSNLLPEYIERISPFLPYIGVEEFATVDEFVELLRESSERIAANIFNVLAVIFGGITTGLFIITLAIFLSLEGNNIENAIRFLTPEKKKETALSVWAKCRSQVNKWFALRIFACLFVGIASYIVFYIFGVNYALVFSVVAGLFNFIPFVGPWVAGIIFFLIIALDSYVKAIFVALAFIVIQFIESSVLLPMLSKRFMRVSPVLVLLAIVIGGSLWGLLGAFLAIPILGILFEYFKAYWGKKKEKEPLTAEN